MGHHICAIIAKLPINITSAEQFDLPVFTENGFAIIALDAEHTDYWQERLDLFDMQEREMILDCAVTPYFARQLGISRYAIIETDYAGGVGMQAAVVYDNQQIIMPTTQGGINAALALLGVKRSAGRDEFDTIRLGEYRDFWDYFEKYRDTSREQD